MNSRDSSAGAGGFSMIELMVSMTIMLIIVGGALTTFQSAVGLSESAAQIADANQNLRAGTNQLIKDVMQTGRIIGPEGIPVPNGKGAEPIFRPGPPPPADPLTFTLTNGSTTLNLPDISTGSALGATINGQATDIITLMTVDPFMAPVETSSSNEKEPAGGSIDPDGAFVELPSDSVWLNGDRENATPPIQVGDLVLFKNALGSAVQTVTRVDGKAVYFDAGDWFNFNQREASAGTVRQISTNGWTATTLFRLLMITYYVEDPSLAKDGDTTAPPRLMRKINNFDAQALAGVVEDLRFTFDLVDGVSNPTEVVSLPYTSKDEVTYTSNQIRKVNIAVGVRSERKSKERGDYIRNRISTSVDVRSLASVDRYGVDPAGP